MPLHLCRARPQRYLLNFAGRFHLLHRCSWKSSSVRARRWQLGSPSRLINSRLRNCRSEVGNVLISDHLVVRVASRPAWPKPHNRCNNMLPVNLLLLAGRRSKLPLQDERLTSSLHLNSASILRDETAARCENSRVTICYHLPNAQHWISNVRHDKQDHRLQPSTVVALEEDRYHPHAVTLQRLVVNVE